MLRAIGFCGVDDSTQPELLDMISARFPGVEWGVLFRPDKEGQPRYSTTACALPHGVLSSITCSTSGGVGDHLVA